MFPFVSVVIPTYGREGVLCSTLRGVLSLGYPNFEVIVVDQSASHEEATAEFLRGLASRNAILWVKESVANLPRARNVGVFYARGEFVLFLDDDITPTPRLIENHIRHFSNLDVWGVAGRVAFTVGELLEQYPLPMNASRAATQWSLPVSRYTTFLPDALRIAGGNFSCRRKQLISIGGFDENYFSNALGEDVEFAGRLRRAGGQIVYDPEAAVIHHVAPHGGCRSGSEDALRYEHYRARNYYYTVGRVKGVGAALWEPFRRQLCTAHRLLGWGRLERSGPRMQPRLGPVREILRSDVSYSAKVWRIARIKVPQVFARIFGFLRGFFATYLDQDVSGHYHRTAAELMSRQRMRPSQIQNRELEKG